MMLVAKLLSLTTSSMFCVTVCNSMYVSYLIYSCSYHIVIINHYYLLRFGLNTSDSQNIKSQKSFSKIERNLRHKVCIEVSWVVLNSFFFCIC